MGLSSGIPVFRTTKGNKNWLEKSERLWVPVIRRLEKNKGSRNRDSIVPTIFWHLCGFPTRVKGILVSALKRHLDLQMISYLQTSKNPFVVRVQFWTQNQGPLTNLCMQLLLSKFENVSVYKPFYLHFLAFSTLPNLPSADQDHHKPSWSFLCQVPG